MKQIILDDYKIEVEQDGSGNPMLLIYDDPNQMPAIELSRLKELRDFLNEHVKG